MKLNYLDLFAGIGGFHLGLKQAGFEFNWSGFSEINKTAKAIYTHHFNESEDLGDVRTIDVNKLPKSIDIITFGFPCQDLSVAGKRSGLRSDRSGLFFDAINIIRHCKPRYFIFENVKGLFSSNEGQDFETILQTITDLDYDGEGQLINTAWFLPQNRERIFFVGFPRTEPRPQIFPFTEDDPIFNDENPNTKAKKTAKLTSIFTSDNQGCRVFDPNGLSQTLLANASESGAKTGLYMLTEQRSDQAKAIRKETFSLQGKDWSPRRGKVLAPRYDEKSNCLTATQTKEHLLSDGVRIRRLTPLECEHLQGFPEGWTLDKQFSDSQRYKCLGNAVSVPVIKAIGIKLKKAMEAI